MKKRLLRTWFFSIVISLSLVLAGCTPADVDTHTYYTVQFDSRGGSQVSDERVMEGNVVRCPSIPVLEGNTFVGWYKSVGENAEEWKFGTDRVNENLTLYAVWAPLSQAEEPTASLTYERGETGYIVTGSGQEEIVVIPATYEGLPVTEIAESAFAYSRHVGTITSVTIPDSVVKIGLNAFHNRTGLVSVNIGENSALAEIGRNAFSGNSDLTSFYVPSGLVSIGSDAFNNCGSIEQFSVSSDNSVYSSLGGHLVEKESGILIRGSNNEVIPDGVTVIASAAFRRAKVNRIQISDTVMEIEKYAFDSCANLAEITVSANNSAFASMGGILYNKALTEIIKVPEAIAGDLSLPATLLEIPYSAFANMTNITSIRIPDGALTNIRNFAFRGLSITIYFEGSESDWGEIAKASLWDNGAISLTVVFGKTEAPKDNESVEGVRIKMVFGSNEVFVTLVDNSATRDLVSRLKKGAITLSFDDYGGSEKIAYLDSKLDTSDVDGCNPVVGDLTVYIPWGNFAAFYADTSAYSSSLVLIGRIEGDGIKLLAAQNGEFTVVMSLV